jgi:hypothetical protein
VQALGFLHVERQGRKTLQRFTLGMQGFNAVSRAARPNSGSDGKRE